VSQFLLNIEGSEGASIEVISFGTPAVILKAALKRVAPYQAFDYRQHLPVPKPTCEKIYGSL